MSCSPPPPPCGAPGTLSPAHLNALAQAGEFRALAVALRDGPELRCALSRHPDGHHADLVHDAGTGTALWAHWSDGDAAGTVLDLPDCPAADNGPGRSGDGCCQYLRHPGAHSWEPGHPAP
ncbi:hypothetical protein ACIRP0_03950 [Streptomyces sp. NPDC101733]|uniref:hypothetical protein n=1 Tax=unclassified Streptomyces TaxID=2593676 RepID=UPI00381F9D69